jgi:hypothetical protein
MIVTELSLTRPQVVPDDPCVFVTPEVYIPHVKRGGNCYQNMGFALGEEAPTKADVLKASPKAKNGVEVIDLQAALEESGSSKYLKHRKEIRFFSQLVNQACGMYIGRGNVQTVSMRTPQPHYFSYDAGRRLFFDRQGELVLLQPEDKTREGSDRLFLRVRAVEGKPNLGYLDLREVVQVMLKKQA